MTDAGTDPAWPGWRLPARRSHAGRGRGLPALRTTSSAAAAAGFPTGRDGSREHWIEARRPGRCEERRADCGVEEEDHPARRAHTCHRRAGDPRRDERDLHRLAAPRRQVPVGQRRRPRGGRADVEQSGSEQPERRRAGLRARTSARQLRLPRVEEGARGGPSVASRAATRSEERLERCQRGVQAVRSIRA